MKEYVASVIQRFTEINGFGVPAADNINDILESLLANDSVICIVKECKGVILGIVYPYAFNPNILIAQELGWWVEPEFRNSSLAIKLLNQFELEAKQKGAHKIIMVGLEAQDPDKVKSIYSRLGYTPLEFSYQKDLKWQ